MKVYSLYNIEGKKVASVQGVYKEACVRAKKMSKEIKSTVLVCRESVAGPKALQAYDHNDISGELIKLDRKMAEIVLKEVMTRPKGAPKKYNSGTTLSVAMSVEDKQKFLNYADKFAKGNGSEMFRRMFTAWENIMEQVIGKQ